MLFKIMKNVRLIVAELVEGVAVTNAHATLLHTLRTTLET